MMRAALCALLLVACGQAEKKTDDVFTCSVPIANSPLPTVEGRGAGKTLDEARSKAWAAACAALPPGEQGDDRCRNPWRYRASQWTSSTTVPDKEKKTATTTHIVAITLDLATFRQTGSGESPESLAAACAAAVTDACKQAGAGPDCVTSGAWVKMADPEASGCKCGHPADCKCPCCQKEKGAEGGCGCGGDHGAGGGCPHAGAGAHGDCPMMKAGGAHGDCPMMKAGGAPHADCPMANH